MHAHAPITDAHLHCWDPSLLSYPWLDSVPTLRRPYFVSEHIAQTAARGVTRRVFVQADCAPLQALAETDWVSGQDAIDAIVAFAPVEDGAALETALRAFATRPKVRGVRRLLQGETAPDFCLSKEFVAGVRSLGRHGLTFDICIRADQLPSVTQLAGLCPEVVFVLDHLGKPPIRAGLLDPWRAHLAAIARLPNVVAKISGLTTEADHAGWTTAHLRPFVAHAVECFGWSRLLFGGDWPVVDLAGGMARWMDAIEELTADASEAEKRALFHENAGRVYRLG
ncbi:MAG: amidohydrolase family protein [Opitutaceae bacterium]|nr:amidohydrolase family protein [Opitutaceae bacterium]